MVRFTSILALATATVVHAQKNTYTTFPDKVADVTSFMSDVYSPSPIPTEVTPYISPLATGLFSVVKSFNENTKYASVHSAIASAMTHAPNPDAVYESVEASGYRYPDVTTNEWYQKNVPSDAKKVIDDFNTAWTAVYSSVADVATRSKNVAPGAQCTGMAVAAGVAAAGMAAIAAM